MNKFLLVLNKVFLGFRVCLNLTRSGLVGLLCFSLTFCGGNNNEDTKNGTTCTESQVYDPTNNTCLSESECTDMPRHVPADGECKPCGGNTPVRNIDLNECLTDCPAGQLVRTGEHTCEIEMTCSGTEPLLLRANNTCLSQLACTSMGDHYIINSECTPCPAGQIRNATFDGCGIAVGFFQASLTTGNFADDTNGGMDAHCRKNVPEALTNAGYQRSKAFFYSPTNIRTLPQLFTGTSTQGLALSASEANTAVVEIVGLRTLTRPQTTLIVPNFYTLNSFTLHSAVIEAMKQIGGKSAWFFINPNDNESYNTARNCNHGTVGTASSSGRILTEPSNFIYNRTNSCNKPLRLFCVIRK